MLFTFPSRYLFAIGLPGVLSLGGWCRRIRTGFLRPRPTPGSVSVGNTFRVRGCHPLWRAFPGLFPYVFPVLHDRPTTPRAPRRPRFGLFPFRSPLLGESLIVFLSSDYLDVSVRRVGHLIRLTGLQPVGFPHSGIRGSKAVRASPRLFAACRVLLRLREPRHPPCALRYLSRTAPVPPPSRLTGPEYPRSFS